MKSDAGTLILRTNKAWRVESLDSATGEHTMNTSTSDGQQGMGGFLGWIERGGNKLPDPVFLFFWIYNYYIITLHINNFLCDYFFY